MKIIERAEKIKPPKICIYGQPGIGKSWLAAQAINPVAIDVEGGLDHVPVPRTDRVRDQYSLQAAIEAVKKSKYNTVIFDTIEAIEDVMVKDLCLAKGVNSLADFGYGKGYDALNKAWLVLLDEIDYLVEYCRKSVILVGHEQQQLYKDPMGDDYDRITLKMNKKSALTLISRMDALFYMTHQKYSQTVGEGLNETVKIKSVGDKILKTTDHPVYVAKNRFGYTKDIDVNDSVMQEIQLTAMKKRN